MISNMNLSTISTEIVHTMGRCWGRVTTCGEATRIVPGLTVMGVFCLAVTAVTESTSKSLEYPLYSNTYILPKKFKTLQMSVLFCQSLQQKARQNYFVQFTHCNLSSSILVSDGHVYICCIPSQILPKYCKLLPNLCIQQYIYYLSGITKQFNKSFH